VVESGCGPPVWRHVTHMDRKLPLVRPRFDDYFVASRSPSGDICGDVANQRSRGDAETRRTRRRIGQSVEADGAAAVADHPLPFTAPRAPFAPRGTAIDDETAVGPAGRARGFEKARRQS
jgi:hypothetical protein